MWRKALIVALLLAVTSVLFMQPAAAQTNPTWLAYYFNNGNLQGDPFTTRTDNNIAFNWGLGAPIAGMNADGFSVRWATDVSLQAGTYRFYALADDNIRVIFNFGLQPVIDTYASGIVGQVVTGDVTVPGPGVYHIQVDYREVDNNAFAYVSYANLATNPQGPGFPVPGVGVGGQSGTLPPTVATAPWTGQYYANGSLLGDPAAILTETSPSHNWGQGSPLPNLPADNFSARWTSVQNLTGGLYTVAARADDSVRVYVNGVQVINQGGATGQTYTVTLNLPAGANTFQVEYSELTLDAYVDFSVYFANAQGNVQPTAAPQLTGAIATVTAFRLNVRDFPSATNTNVITRINRFEQYQIVGRTADSQWYQIQLANNLSGWVSARFISITNGFNIPVTTPGTVSPTPVPTQPAQPSGIIGTATPYTVNLRSGPGTQFARLGRIVAGGQAAVIGRNAATQWLQVNYNGIVGWVSAQYFVLPSGTNVNNIPVTG
jgi:uncharacterized protein YraI